MDYLLSGSVMIYPQSSQAAKCIYLPPHYIPPLPCHLQALLVNGQGLPYASFSTTPENAGAIMVERGLTYRLRVICASSLSYYKWGIEGARFASECAHVAYSKHNGSTVCRCIQ